MLSFGQRYGYQPTQIPFQREAIDDALRTKLWNILSATVWSRWRKPDRYGSQTPDTAAIEGLVRRIWVNFLNRDLDLLPDFRNPYGNSAYAELKHFFFGCQWFDVYNLLEELSEDKSNLLTQEIRDYINDELEHHNAAYRFVGGTIAEITSEHDISAIESALSSSADPVRQHLADALRMLSDRQNPDYRNSIKESISAVEAVCRIVTGKPNATLSDALKKIPNLHGALAAGFDKIYGYTSDASGIRHSLTEQAAPNTYSEAKFMLVACSGFTSYLLASSKGG